MKKFVFAFCLLGSAALTACSGTQETLGLTRQSPDEFAVVRHAPLSMPPNYNLRPPQPGAPRPQEQETSAQARQAVFGDQQSPNTGNITDGENALLQKAGADMAAPDIRQTVDRETASLKNKNKPVAKRLLGLAGQSEEPYATVLDPEEEAERLKKETSTTVTEPGSSENVDNVETNKESPSDHNKKTEEQ